MSSTNGKDNGKERSSDMTQQISAQVERDDTESGRLLHMA